MEKWQRRGAKLFCVAMAVFFVYLILKYALSAIFPFLLALAIALPLSSLAKKTARFFGGGEKAWSVFYVICFWSFILIALFALIKKLYFELSDLSDYFENNADMINKALQDTFDKIISLPSRVPFLNSFLGNNVEFDIGPFISDALKRIFSALSAAVSKIALGTPKMLLGSVATVIASFYLCRDLEQIKEYLVNSFPKSMQGKMKNIFVSITGGIRAYAKAYSKLFLVSFFCFFVGLLVLGRKYSLIIALFLAFFDLLPLFGAGIVLAPWGIVLISEGATTIGVGLIILAVLVSVIRQICEARFVGKELDIHPLASFAGMYIGLRIFGFWGMIIAPLVILVIKQGRREMKKAN